MSTGPERNPRGVRVWQRDAAGEIIPEPEGGASPNALFARTFATIANGLHALPENIVEPVRILPERFFPPPWIFWLLVHVIKHVANDRRTWEFVRANCPVRCTCVERRGRRTWHPEPASVANDEFECAFEMAHLQPPVFEMDRMPARTQATARVRRRDLEIHTQIPLRIEAVSESEAALQAWQDFVPLTSDALAWHEGDQRFGVAGARLGEFVPPGSWQYLLGDLRAMQLVLRDRDAITAIRDYDSVVLDLCRRLEDPQWRPWVAALAGDWFLLEDLATAASNQELLAEARRQTDLCIHTWLTDPNGMADWGPSDEYTDWRPYCLRMIHRRGGDYFRERIQPNLRDLRWIADWGGALPPFCDESWRPDLLRIIERLLNTPRHDAAMTCIEHLLRNTANVDTVMQTINDVGVLDARRWEELAFLLMTYAPQLAMPVIENAIAAQSWLSLVPFLAYVDAEWSRRILQSELQNPAHTGPGRTPAPAECLIP